MQINNDEYDFGHNVGHYHSDGEGNIEECFHPKLTSNFHIPMIAIYIKASWCGTCRVALPKFLAECERLNFKHKVLDAEDDAEQVDAYRVRNVPTIIVVHEETGEEILRGRAEDVIPKLKDL